MAATLALVQINAERSGTSSPLTIFATSFVSFAQSASSFVVDGVRGGASNVAALPSLAKENARLRDENRVLAADNARVHELTSQYAAEVSVQPAVDIYPSGVEARVVGFPPENDSRTVTIDRGANAGVKKDDGVIAAGGIVGRVDAVGPFSSDVVLITDYTGRLPCGDAPRALLGHRTRQSSPAYASSTFHRMLQSRLATSLLRVRADRFVRGFRLGRSLPSSAVMPYCIKPPSCALP